MSNLKRPALGIVQDDFHNPGHDSSLEIDTETLKSYKCARELQLHTRTCVVALDMSNQCLALQTGHIPSSL